MTYEQALLSVGFTSWQCEVICDMQGVVPGDTWPFPPPHGRPQPAPPTPPTPPTP